MARQEKGLDYKKVVDRYEKEQSRYEHLNRKLPEPVKDRAVNYLKISKWWSEVRDEAMKAGED